MDVKNGTLDRGLTQAWLEQNRVVDAWKLWEWSKARPLHTDPGDGVPAAWPNLQQAILSLPVPSNSGERPVYGSSMIAWMFGQLKMARFVPTGFPSHRKSWMGWSLILYATARIHHRLWRRCRSRERSFLICL